MDYDLLSLKLHVSDTDEVWYSYADGPPICSGETPVSFLLHPMVREIPLVRMMGWHKNTHLALALFMERVKAGKGVLEVCSPLACQTQAERQNPARALTAIRTHEQSTAAGGWHRFNRDDYVSYSLATHLQKHNRIDTTAIALLHKHPVWAPLSFIPHLHKPSVCRLLALILDPRWFVDPRHMSRGTKLRAFLGLTRPNMESVLVAGKGAYRQDNCKLVFDSWHNVEDRDNIDQPNHFLWRIYRQHSEKIDQVTGALRASQAFVEYLRLTWLAAIGRGHKQAEPLFLPSHYFKLTTEVEAFLEHFSRLYGKKDNDSSD